MAGLIAGQSAVGPPVLAGVLGPFVNPWKVTEAIPFDHFKLRPEFNGRAQSQVQCRQLQLDPSYETDYEPSHAVSSSKLECMLCNFYSDPAEVASMKELCDNLYIQYATKRPKGSVNMEKEASSVSELIRQWGIEETTATRILAKHWYRYFNSIADAQAGGKPVLKPGTAAYELLVMEPVHIMNEAWRGSGLTELTSGEFERVWGKMILIHLASLSSELSDELSTKQISRGSHSKRPGALKLAAIHRKAFSLLNYHHTSEELNNLSHDKSPGNPYEKTPRLDPNKSSLARVTSLFLPENEVLGEVVHPMIEDAIKDLAMFFGGHNPHPITEGQTHMFGRFAFGRLGPETFEFRAREGRPRFRLRRISLDSDDYTLLRAHMKHPNIPRVLEVFAHLEIEERHHHRYFWVVEESLSDERATEMRDEVDDLNVFRSACRFLKKLQTEGIYLERFDLSQMMRKVAREEGEKQQDEEERYLAKIWPDDADDDRDHNQFVMTEMRKFNLHDNSVKCLSHTQTAQDLAYSGWATYRNPESDFIRGCGKNAIDFLNQFSSSAACSASAPMTRTQAAGIRENLDQVPPEEVDYDLLLRQFEDHMI